MSELDFKAALGDQEEQTQLGIFSTEHYKTIQTALRIADRLQDIPSWKMLLAASDLYPTAETETDIMLSAMRDDKFKEIFKAMAKQLIKEES